MKKLLIWIIALLVSLSLAACNIGANHDNSGLDAGGNHSNTGSKGGSDGPADDSVGAPPAFPFAPDTDGGGGSENRNGIKSGQLTAGEWSDIKNYTFYLNLYNTFEDANVEESQRRSTFSQFIDYFGFETRYMVTVNVMCNSLPAGDAVVELYSSDQTKLFAAKTDVRGNAYLFPSYDLNGEHITVKVHSGTYKTEQTFTYDRGDLHITLDGRSAVQSVLDIMFVIDTTGSMGDELKYLKEEISDVIGTISRDNPNYTINLALLFYRDIGDDYVTRYFDFTANIAQQQQNLAKQSVNGGGDFPEAADRALSEAMEKSWNSAYATRLIFHVCDAPPHDDQASKTLYFNAIKTAAQKGIRIIPVASSGIDHAAEYLLRQEALMTGGTYIFLTDDSGIGGSHLQATVGEYTVEYLNACIVRVINEYLTGVETEPVLWGNQETAASSTLN